jgi:SAM-dependent methyltransferase
MDDLARDAIDHLRAYLDEIRFRSLFKYVVSSHWYYVTPTAVSAKTAAAVAALDRYVVGAERHALAFGLMLGHPIALAALTPDERGVAARLIAAGLLDASDDHARASRYQLIAARDLALLVDRGGGFPAERTAEVYLGADSYLGLHYLDLADRPRRCLDLCTGTGLHGLAMASVAEHVVCTDVSPAALALAALNIRLNDRTAIIELRAESLLDTIRGAATYDRIASNPPFLPIPADIALPPALAGLGLDGPPLLDALLAAVPAMLADRGVAIVGGDLLGDAARPFVVDRLTPLAATGLAIQVFVDRRVPIATHLDTLARFAQCVRPGIDAVEVRAILADLLVAQHGVAATYLTTIEVRRGRPGVIVYNRHRA